MLYLWACLFGLCISKSILSHFFLCFMLAQAYSWTLFISLIPSCRIPKDWQPSFILSCLLPLQNKLKLFMLTRCSQKACQSFAYIKEIRNIAQEGFPKIPIGLNDKVHKSYLCKGFVQAHPQPHFQSTLPGWLRAVSLRPSSFILNLSCFIFIKCGQQREIRPHLCFAWAHLQLNSWTCWLQVLIFHILQHNSDRLSAILQ